MVHLRQLNEAVAERLRGCAILLLQFPFFDSERNVRAKRDENAGSP